MFRLQFDGKLTKISLQFDSHGTSWDLLDSERTRLAVLNGGQYAWRCDYQIGTAAEHGPNHPYAALTTCLGGGLPAMPGVFPATIRIVLNADLARQYAQLKGDQRRREQFTKILASVTGGSVHTILSRTGGPNMEAMDDGYLYGLTCVFPWAVDLLKKRPRYDVQGR
jgi:hypothetical protein